MFNIDCAYSIDSRPTLVRDFFEYLDDYVVRPPYQRKNVWSTKKQQDLMDSLLRRDYIPPIVLREVMLGENTMRYEVIDGQQRITTVQRFFDGGLRLPDSLADLDERLPGKRYADLPPDIRKFVDKVVKFDVDVVQKIGDPTSAEHQMLAARIFGRLQEGMQLNFIEVAHSRLSSLTRNFVAKYADDISFDFDTYKPLDINPHRHRFFGLLKSDNSRMGHLALLTRLLMIEMAGGARDLKNSDVRAFIDDWRSPDGINDLSFEDRPEAKTLLACLTEFHRILSKDPTTGDGSPVPELSREYFVLSFVMLLRHLRRHYALKDVHREEYRLFLHEFYEADSDRGHRDELIVLFRENRRQGKQDVEIRDRVLRELFFRRLDERKIVIVAKDTKRAFNEAERLSIYRRDRGLCQGCLRDGRPEKEAQVAWSEWEAHHVLPHTEGGKTTVENGEVLCVLHHEIITKQQVT